MGQPIFVKNIPIDERRISFIENVVTRLARRARKQTSAIITPVPISNCVTGEEVKGDILKYMFCCPGKINKGGIFLDKKPESGAAVILTIDNDLGGSSKSYSVTRKNILFEPNIDVDTWDKLTISFFAVDPEKDKMTKVWIGFLWTPSIKDITVKSYLIDALDEGVDVS